MVTWAKMDRLAKCIYLVQTEDEFLNIISLVVWNWITVWVCWYDIGTFGILVLDHHVGIMALYD